MAHVRLLIGDFDTALPFIGSFSNTSHATRNTQICIALGKPIDVQKRLLSRVYSKLPIGSNMFTGHRPVFARRSRMRKLLLNFVIQSFLTSLLIETGGCYFPQNQTKPFGGFWVALVYQS